MTSEDAPAPSEGGRAVEIDGIAATSYLRLVERLAERFPASTLHEIEAVVQREHEAFTGGRPIVVPEAVERGAIELLET